MIIALDGPAAAGKGTLAKRLSTHYRLPYLDTGLLYRSVGVLAFEKGLDLGDEAAVVSVATLLQPHDLARDDLRSAAAGEYASRVAVLPKVRAQLLAFQRDFALQPSGAILDGRDIGTVIAPQADVKFFIMASAEARAARRFLELQAAGAVVSRETLTLEIIARDERDASRAHAPFVIADDAVLIDTTFMSADDAFYFARDVIDLTINSKSSSRDNL